MISAALAILENEDERNELAEIYNQNVKTFYSIAFSRLHNQDDAEDAIQDAFLAIANNPDIFFRVPKQKRVRKRILITIILIICLALATGAVIAFVSDNFRGTVYNDNTYMFAFDTSGCPTSIPVSAETTTYASNDGIALA